MIQLGKALAIGGQPSIRQLRELATRGFASILNLRCEREARALIEPHEEAWLARLAGLAYGHFPIRGGEPHRECMERFRQQLGKLAEPVYVHCSDGQRAAMVGLVHIALDKDDTLEEALDRGAALGVRIECPDRREWVRHCLENCRTEEGDRMQTFRWVSH